jgi:multidrug resistance protein, MATE family
MLRQIVQHLRREFPAMLRLAVPLVVAELGWMSMGVVDTMMVARLPNSAVAMGTVSLGHILFFAFAIFSLGMVFGLDPIVSQAFGGGRIADCHRALWSAVLLCFPLAAFVMGAVYAMPVVLRMIHTNPEVLGPATAYVRVSIWGALPLLLFHTFRSYLQAMNLVKPITFALVTANLINAGGNWLLIYGHCGFPALGVTGSAWSTVGAQAYLWLVVMSYAIWHDRRNHTGMFRGLAGSHAAYIRELLRLGGPAATHMIAEIGVWGTATVLIGRLNADALAGHQIAINAVSLLFMVPLGVSQAGSVRVGQALGAGDPRAAARSGWTALLLGATLGCLSAASFLLFPGFIVRLYSPDPVVQAFGAQLLLPCACFQLFDALQVTATGALRGAGNTRIAMTVHLLYYWLFGLPLGYALCFWAGWGALGMWCGLSAAIVLIGITLLDAWRKKQRQFQSESQYSRQFQIETTG